MLQIVIIKDFTVKQKKQQLTKKTWMDGDNVDKMPTA